MRKCEQQFRGYLDRRRLLFTRERKAILNAIHSHRGHFDVDDLILLLRRSGSRVSRGTVYRTIPLLVEAGILRKVAFTDRHAHYEDTAKTDHHEHLICLNCGKVIEFSRPGLERVLMRICREYGFAPVAHKMEVTGYCPECARIKMKEIKR